MQNQIYNNILFNKKNNIKGLAVLLDPDKIVFETLPDLVLDCVQNNVSYFFVGGSLISNHQLKELIGALKKICTIPVVLFPGNGLHIDILADSILLLSLISGRNADFLIGQHVVAAPILKNSNLEILPTGYLLIDSGQQTTASYMSNTTPIPGNKPEIAACTAMAGEMLGLKLIYLDGGSGAKNVVSPELIKAVKGSIECPILVGGGINTISKAIAAWDSGADIIVIGNKIEEDPDFINQLGKVLKEKNGILI